MIGTKAIKKVQHHSEMHESESKTTLGFWVYPMTDCLLFASLFATFIVLRGNIADGSEGKDLFSLPFVLTETILLLTSSFTCGLALLAARARNRNGTLLWLGITAALGLAFLGMEPSEFTKLVHEDHSWTRSAFMSAFFTLVGTHGLHITVGLVWAFVLIARIAGSGLTKTVQKLALFSLFWHFLDIVWIFIFTIVYMIGAV